MCIKCPLGQTCLHHLDFRIECHPILRVIQKRSRDQIKRPDMMRVGTLTFRTMKTMARGRGMKVDPRRGRWMMTVMRTTVSVQTGRKS